MRKYRCSPPKFKDSTKLIYEQANVKCKFKNSYKNLIVIMVNYLRGFDWYTQIDV